MRKKIINIVLALVLTAAGLVATNQNALAGNQTTGWDVTYDGKSLNSSYDVSKSTITNAMPGDTIIYNVSYINSSADTTEFYLSTDIIDSLEDKNADGSGGSDAKGGAYSYKISYVLDGTTNVLYDSETVGGDSTTVAGLNQLKNSMEEGKRFYFSVGTLTTGKSGTVTIEIKLDGNSQDNSYMSKLATLDVKFGVEKVTPPSGGTNVVNKTVTKREVYTIPGGTQTVVSIDDPTVPLEGGGPVTGDSILPIIICSIGILVGLMFIVWYIVISKKLREEVA